MHRRSGGGSGEMTFTSEEDHGTEEEEKEQGDEQYTDEERCLRPRANGDEDLLAVLKRFRINWTRSMAPYIGPVEATSTTRC
ncbi:unnamed protein product [Urochloa humidicola]